MQLEDDQLFYCQNHNLNELISLITRNYKKFVSDEDSERNIKEDMEKLDPMKEIFSKGPLSYFVIEKIIFKKYKHNVNGK